MGNNRFYHFFTIRRWMPCTAGCTAGCPCCLPHSMPVWLLPSACQVALAAMTGCAAELIGGRTLHSCLQLGLVTKVGAGQMGDALCSVCCQSAVDACVHVQVGQAKVCFPAVALLASQVLFLLH